MTEQFKNVIVVKHCQSLFVLIRKLEGESFLNFSFEKTEDFHAWAFLDLYFPFIKTKYWLFSVVHLFIVCFRVLNDSNDDFYTLFSLLYQLNSNPLIPSKMSSSPIIKHFYPLNYIFSIVFYTYFIISVSVLNFYILLILFPILWSP